MCTARGPESHRHGTVHLIPTRTFRHDRKGYAVLAPGIKMNVLESMTTLILMLMMMMMMMMIIIIIVMLLLLMMRIMISLQTPSSVDPLVAHSLKKWQVGKASSAKWWRIAWLTARDKVWESHTALVQEGVLWSRGLEPWYVGAKHGVIQRKFPAGLLAVMATQRLIKTFASAFQKFQICPSCRTHRNAATPVTLYVSDLPNFHGSYLDVLKLGPNRQWR